MIGPKNGQLWTRQKIIQDQIQQSAIENLLDSTGSSELD